jgi:hypothetical protein
MPTFFEQLASRGLAIDPAIFQPGRDTGKGNG